jgi:hypothetical protein
VLAFHVGVSGHRHLPGADLKAIQAAAFSLFRALGDEATALHAADQTSADPLYALAPPRLRCVCGLAEGADSLLAAAALDAGWQLGAILPFPAEDYAADFAGDALAGYRALLSQAATVCTLDGDRDSPAAYADCGEMVAEQSDLLIAVWDGKPARGPGGTGDVVQHALARSLPVAILPPSGPAAVRWLNAAGDTAVTVEAALRRPAVDPVIARAWSAGPSGAPGWARSSLRAYERLMTAGRHIPALAPGPPAVFSPATRTLTDAFERADRLATEHATRYRAAGLMRYGLILPATVCSLLGWYGAPWLQPLGNLGDFAILTFILYFSRKGWWGLAHRRFVAFRAAAEQLRYARMLACLGATVPTPGSQAGAADWTAWYSRAAVREQGVVPLVFTPATVAAARDTVREEARGQIAFLRVSATRFEAMALRLRRIGVALFLCGMVFSAVRALLLLAGARPEVLRGFNETALVLPAMAPVFLGLLSFNEYSTLATRYRAVAAELERLLPELDAAAPQRPAVLAVARRIADTLLAEGADWQRLIRARTMSAY